MDRSHPAHNVFIHLFLFISPLRDTCAMIFGIIPCMQGNFIS